MTTGIKVSYSEEFSPFAFRIYKAKYAHKLASGRKEDWHEIADRQVQAVVAPYMPDLVEPIRRLIRRRQFMPGGRYLYAAGRKYPQVNNCFLFRAEDSREGWGDLMTKTTQSLMTGGGIGVVYSRLRAEGEIINGMGGTSTGPCALCRMVNESGRYIMQGGSRRSAIWAGLHWNHKDVFKFIGLKNWPDWLAYQKRLDFNVAAPMDGTNISVILDNAFFAAYEDDNHQDHCLAHDVFWQSVRSMLMTGEPGFSVDIGENSDENLRNACTEVTSRDDSDMCNLGSLNLARFETPEEFAEGVRLGTAFLLCGTLYSKLPMENMYRVREKNRRLGLGLMGVHEWLLVRGRRYGPDAELGKWLEAYKMSGSFANLMCDRMGLSRSIATRAVAPNGTIGIAAETTTSGEPIPYVAYKRRYLDGNVWKAQYVVDPTARRLIASGVDPSLIEDSSTLAEDVGRRMAFQAWLQTFVDHGISSTVNLPPWGSEFNNERNVTSFGNMLLKYLPELRGITAYPDGSRGGQPFVRVPYEEAVSKGEAEFIESAEGDSLATEMAALSCKTGGCGE